MGDALRFHSPNRVQEINEILKEAQTRNQYGLENHFRYFNMILASFFIIIVSRE